MRQRSGESQPAGAGRLSTILDHAEEIAAGGLVMGLCLLAFANVLTRYVVSYSLAFSEELEVAGLVWLTMLGAAIGFRRSAHIGFTVVRDRLPRIARIAATALGAAVTAGVFLVLVWYGLRQIQAERSLDAVSEALGIPQWTYTTAIPVGALLVLVRVLQAARRDIPGD